MCCLKYRQDAYEDLLKDTPKLESLVGPPDGVGVVNQVQLLREQVKVVLDQDRTPQAVPQVGHRRDSQWQGQTVRRAMNSRSNRRNGPAPVWFRSPRLPLPPFRSRSVRSGGENSSGHRSRRSGGRSQGQRRDRPTVQQARGTAGRSPAKRDRPAVPAGIPADRPTLLQMERAEPDRGAQRQQPFPHAAAITGPRGHGGQSSAPKTEK